MTIPVADTMTVDKDFAVRWYDGWIELWNDRKPELILACDLIVAAAGATFTDAHTSLGIAPAVGAAAALVRAVGEFRAKRLLLASDSHDAATMADYGLVTEVTEPGGLERRTTELAATLSQRSPVSFAAMKAMVHRAQQPSWEETLQSDLAFFRTNWGSEAMREGLAAYTRPPTFGPA